MLGTILVVEDEPTSRDLARRILESGGFQVHFAEEGVDGLEVFARHRYEIVAVLFDLTMPLMSGNEVVCQLGSQEPDWSDPVMSVFGEVVKAKGFHGNGASRFIQKPFQPRELIVRMGQAVSSGVCDKTCGGFVRIHLASS